MPNTDTPHDVEVNAEPTKDLFIEMLVRDIELVPAIVDLVDNSVDGARHVVHRNDHLPGDPEQPLEDFFLHIKTADDSLVLDDNCGGISLEDAEKYAFRFGRIKTKELEQSIGQFGVGMKRAFFKLGARFYVESVTDSSRFELPVNVSEWRHAPGWHFMLKNVVEGDQNPDDVGTRIRISPLLPLAAEQIGASGFSTHLLDELAARHQQAIDEGFDLRVDDIRAPQNPSALLASSAIVPAYVEMAIETDTEPVRVKIICGIGDSRPGDAGWDVLCNGRTVLRSDQTSVTGWGGDASQVIPSYHNQFARFRGFVYFDSKDAAQVPWTTTKTGLDQDSKVWQATRQKMILLMRPVIDFLNDLDNEKDREASDSTGGTLGAAVQKASSTPLTTLEARAAFKYPSVTKAPRAGRIAYTRPKSAIEQAKKTLDVTTAREVGELTFDYWVESELD